MLTTGAYGGPEERTMAPTSPRYGKPNFEMLKSWIERPPEQDGPFWALNLMKYRATADYQDGRAAHLSGRAADDAYAPLASLKAIGAMVVLHANVARQWVGEPYWERVAIVRYPTRAAFFAMQQRDDFKQQHVHKDAGMECTIVLSCLPNAKRPPIATPPCTLLLRVARMRESGPLPEVDGATRIATFDVEGVIVGDDRSWTQVAFDATPNGEVTDATWLQTGPGIEEMFAIVLARPRVDAIAQSIFSAP